MDLQYEYFAEFGQGGRGSKNRKLCVRYISIAPMLLKLRKGISLPPFAPSSSQVRVVGVCLGDVDPVRQVGDHRHVLELVVASVEEEVPGDPRGVEVPLPMRLVVDDVPLGLEIGSVHL